MSPCNCEECPECDSNNLKKLDDRYYCQDCRTISMKVKGDLTTILLGGLRRAEDK